MSHYFKARILCIDDDNDTLDLVKIVLERAGYEVNCAVGWDEVLDFIHKSEDTKRPYDVIILDIMMPEQSGFDVLSSMKVVLRPIPPVIFLTAKYSMEDMVQASDMGAAKYLVKPTTPDKLLEAVGSVLSKSR
jgi:two-component system phosphate regulon response regulator PhoB